MDALGWDACDIILVTGDAYVDHPSFGMAIVGRLLEAQGFRVGIIAQPDWQSAEPFKALGQPTLFFGITGGNMDSMVNRYTSDRRLRHNDNYTPGGAGGKRPDRAVIVYAQRCPRGLQGRDRSCSAASRARCAASRTTTTGRTRCAARSWPTPRATSCSTATPSARSSRSRTGWRASEPIETFDDIRGVALFKSAVPEGWTELQADDIDERRRRRAADQGQHRRSPAVVRAGGRGRGSLCARLARAASREQSRQRARRWCSGTATANCG